MNLHNSVRNNERANVSQSSFSHDGGPHPTYKYYEKQRKENGFKKLPFISYNSNKKRIERNGRKPNMCFICESEDHFIANFPKTDI